MTNTESCVIYLTHGFINHDGTVINRTRLTKPSLGKRAKSIDKNYLEIRQEIIEKCLAKAYLQDFNKSNLLALDGDIDFLDFMFNTLFLSARNIAQMFNCSLEEVRDFLRKSGVVHSAEERQHTQRYIFASKDIDIAVEGTIGYIAMKNGIIKEVC